MPFARFSQTRAESCAILMVFCIAFHQPDMAWPHFEVEKWDPMNECWTPQIFFPKKRISRSRKRIQKKNDFTSSDPHHDISKSNNPHLRGGESKPSAKNFRLQSLTFGCWSLQLKADLFSPAIGPLSSFHQGGSPGGFETSEVMHLRCQRIYLKRPVLHGWLVGLDVWRQIFPRVFFNWGVFLGKKEWGSVGKKKSGTPKICLWN